MKMRFDWRQQHIIYINSINVDKKNPLWGRKVLWNMSSNECKPLKMPNLLSSFSKHNSVFEFSKNSSICFVTISLWFHRRFFGWFLKSALHIFGACELNQKRVLAWVYLFKYFHIHNLEYTPSHDTNFTIIYRFFLWSHHSFISRCLSAVKKDRNKETAN